MSVDDVAAADADTGAQTRAWRHRRPAKLPGWLQIDTQPPRTLESSPKKKAPCPIALFSVASVSTMKVEVEGFTGCPHFNEASRIWREKAAQHPDIELAVHDRPRDQYVPWVKEHTKVCGRLGKTHAGPAAKQPTGRLRTLCMVNECTHRKSLARSGRLRRWSSSTASCLAATTTPSSLFKSGVCNGPRVRCTCTRENCTCDRCGTASIIRFTTGTGTCMSTTKTGAA